VPLIVFRALRSPADFSPLACWIRATARQIGCREPDALSATEEQTFHRVARTLVRRLEQRKAALESVIMQDTVRA
jgi:hypothetical protein